MELLPKKACQISRKESLAEAHEEIHNEVCKVHVDAPLCSPHGDEGLVRSSHFHVFETKPYKDDNCEHDFSSTSA